MDKSQINQLLKLPRNEKIELVLAIWDNIAQEQTDSEIPDEHKKLLDQRMQNIQNGNTKFKSWGEIKQKYRSLL
ncbi:MAG TPA: hypothetical protein ENH82_02460 [bacterium]|nr:hypothetical protein [bacterium]